MSRAFTDGKWIEKNMRKTVAVVLSDSVGSEEKLFYWNGKRCA